MKIAGYYGGGIRLTRPVRITRTGCYLNSSEQLSSSSGMFAFVFFSALAVNAENCVRYSPQPILGNFLAAAQTGTVPAVLQAGES